ncbi:MAG: hypothetical protein IH603_10025, partial [Burkholderia vietnamiensis]|nr:hypothetical protein [Burkholderia vietnamiensis]
ANDGSGVYFLAAKDGIGQLWQVDAKGGAPRQITFAPVDVGNFKLSPDGKRVLLSFDVFADCDTLACTKQKLDARKADKASGTVYDKIFVRHWDTWADGRRSQLYVADFGGDGRVQGIHARLAQHLRERPGPCGAMLLDFCDDDDWALVRALVACNGFVDARPRAPSGC